MSYTQSQEPNTLRQFFEDVTYLAEQMLENSIFDEGWLYPTGEVRPTLALQQFFVEQIL